MHVLSVLFRIIRIFQQIAEKRPLGCHFRRTQTQAAPVGSQGFVIIPGYPFEKLGIRITIQVIVMGHDAIGVPILEHVVRRKPFEENGNV